MEENVAGWQFSWRQPGMVARGVTQGLDVFGLLVLGPMVVATAASILDAYVGAASREGTRESVPAD